MKRIATVLMVIFLALFVSHAQRPQSLQENMLLSAVKKYNEGNYDAARSTLNGILEKDGSIDAAWYYLAMVSLATDDIETAESCLRRAVELDSKNFWYRYRLAGIYAVTSRDELTVDIYEKLLKDFPRRSELYFDLVELYSAQDEPEKALKTLDEIETVFGMTESTAIYRFNLLRGPAVRKMHTSLWKGTTRNIRRHISFPPWRTIRYRCTTIPRLLHTIMRLWT